MAWFKIDDRLHTHPKIHEAGIRAMGLWVLAGSWSSAHLTDGFVPKYVLKLLGTRPQDARDLVRAGLWLEVENGWQFHDWNDYNPTREEVESEREAARNRQRQARERRREASGKLGGHGDVTPMSHRDVTRESHVSHSVSHGVSHTTPTRPDPTRPIPTPIGVGGAGGCVSPETDDEPVDNPVPAKAVTPNKRGTRIMQDFMPARTDANLKVEAGRTRESLELELAQFRDYWGAKSGKDATKIDWDATWRSWLRNADKYAANRPKPQTTFEQMHAEAARLDALDEQAALESRTA